MARVVQVMQGVIARDQGVARLVERVKDLRRERPELADALSGTLGHYITTLEGYQRTGIYDREWSRLPAPPFGAETVRTPLGGLQLAHVA